MTNEDLFIFISAHYQILIIIVFCLTGALVKDILNTIKDKNCEVDLTRIFVSSITACIISYSFTNSLIEMGIPNELLVTIYFVCGLTGFNLLEKLSSFEGIADFLTYIKDYFCKKK